MDLVILEKIEPSILNGLGYIGHLEKKNGSKIVTCHDFTSWHDDHERREVRVDVWPFCSEAKKWDWIGSIFLYSRWMGIIAKFSKMP